MDPNQQSPDQQPGVPTPPQVGAPTPQPMNPADTMPSGEPVPGGQPLPQPGVNQPQQPMQPGAPMHGGGGSSKKLFMIVGGIVGLLILVIVLVLVLGGGSDDAASGDSETSEESSENADSGSETEDTQSESEGSSGGSGAALPTDGPDIQDSYAIDVTCEEMRIPGNLIASTDNTFKVETFLESNNFPGSYSSMYAQLETRNRTDFDNDLNVDGIACVTAKSEVKQRVDCPGTIDDQPVTLKKKVIDFEMTLYDAHSGEVIGEATIKGDAECPSFFATVDENNEFFSEPDAEDAGDKIADLTKGL